ncbi:MAG: acylphosphatase [Methanomicrobiales archaeon]|nr:acylphosphatase [Methanomicrobiales archaeon]
MKRYSIIAYGRVQGVGFRAYVQELAYTFHLSGWVRNLPDGTVECEAEGEDEQVKKFMEIIQNTNRQFIQVTNLKTGLMPVSGEQGFFIRR